MSSELMVVLASAVASWFMTGIIWFVQVVHYPLFQLVGAPGFAGYENGHTRRTSLVVVPVMLAELLTTFSIPMVASPSAEPLLVWGGVALVASVWLVTFLVQVPLHARLKQGYDQEVATRLVMTNWIRVSLWSARSVLITLLLLQLVSQQV